MVFDIIDKHNGFLAFTTEKYGKVKKTDPKPPMHACVFQKFRESRGYRTGIDLLNR